MRILLTNDDGIHAPGIIALHEALMDLDGRFGGPLAGPSTEVFTVAPLTVQSATGHGVTFHRPLMLSRHEVTPRFHGHAVDGRPADCVKVALANLWPEWFGAGAVPDLVISGMNMGANCGINVLYSGTVAAALEGAFHGVPSIAVSLPLGKGRARYDVAAARARKTIEGILRSAGHGLEFKGLERESDVDFLLRRCVTVTPLNYDMSCDTRMTEWRARLGELMPDTSAADRPHLDDPSPADQGD